MDQPPAAAFTASADVWPRATGNGDRRRPMRHWRGKDFGVFDYLNRDSLPMEEVSSQQVICAILEILECYTDFPFQWLMTVRKCNRLIVKVLGRRLSNVVRFSDL